MTKNKKQKQNIRRAPRDLHSPEEVLTIIGAHYIIHAQFRLNGENIFNDLGITIENFNLEETINAALNFIQPIDPERLN